MLLCPGELGWLRETRNVLQLFELRCSLLEPGSGWKNDGSVSGGVEPRFPVLSMTTINNLKA